LLKCFTINNSFSDYKFVYSEHNIYFLSANNITKLMRNFSDHNLNMICNKIEMSGLRPFINYDTNTDIDWKCLKGKVLNIINYI
jgi:hypothetical protein